MVTYYNEKDLVSFGKYLLNPERAKRFHARYQEELKEGNNPVPPEELIPLVHHADLENWRHEQKQLKIKKEIARSIKG